GQEGSVVSDVVISDSVQHSYRSCSRGDASLHWRRDDPVLVRDPASAAIGHCGELLLESLVVSNQFRVPSGQVVWPLQAYLRDCSLGGANSLCSGPVEIGVRTIVFDPETFIDSLLQL